MSASSFVVHDTSPEVNGIVVERWRAMSARECFELVAALNDSCERMAQAGIRLRHPDASADEVRLRLIALRLGRDMMVAAYGWDPESEGW